jgi:hypothetical protein
MAVGFVMGETPGRVTLGRYEKFLLLQIETLGMFRHQTAVTKEAELELFVGFRS